MKNSTTILATIALGAALAVGSATASMARGGMGGHGGEGFGGGHQGSGSGTQSFMTNGSGSDGGRSEGGNHGSSHGRHFSGLRGNDDANAFFGFGPFCSYGPASGQYAGRYERHYCS